MRPRFALGLRAQLALVALTLLALPWAGYRYVKEMERFLLEAQEQAQIATSRAIATALHGRPQLMRLQLAIDSELRSEAEAELQRLAAARGETPAGADSAFAAAATAREIARESAPREQVAEIDAILAGLERTTARIWVVNRDYRVLALAGSLKHPEAADAPDFWQKLLGRLIKLPTEDFDEAIAADVLATGRDIAGALQGRPGARVRKTPDGRAAVVSAAYPIWNGEDVLGAVVVEETTNSILSVRSRALERLLLVTLAAFTVAAAVLLAFATRLSHRIRRLRDEAESAVDARGRLTTRIDTGSDARDEIGDLSRSFSTMLARLSQHHAYLESMASRLSHELRTPIAVVRSSLENLELQPLPGEARVYIERAEEGLARLNTILRRMSEATRLEQGLASQERERFDLAAVVAGCVEGYRGAYPGHAFELRLPGSRVEVDGAPDLAAQLLDKLVANAVDFSSAGAAIGVCVEHEGGMARVSVQNQGPPLPDEMRGTLFESMISVRKERGGEPHLGLGLYIARLIAEFHGGTVRADNLPSGDGVVVSATFRGA
ncbi:MAG: HAMP domain-containing protein [Burkholderiales bacterium]|nr:HAMP domain-containing protein [Burkholderiales bacterium]